MLEGLPDPPSHTGDLRAILTEDAIQHWLRLKQENTDLNRRAYVRSVFALIEGVIAILKQHTLAELKAGRITLTPGQLSLLLESSYSASDQGEPLERGAFIPTPQNIRFTFAIFTKAHPAARLPDYSDHRWRSLVSATRVRNRITHPRSAAELSISADEIAMVEEATGWFLKSSLDAYIEGRAELIVRLETQGFGTVTE